MEANRNQTNLNRIQMANEHHSNPIINLLYISCGGLFAYIQTNGFFIEGAIEIFKVIFFGLIGGACGYLGKYLAEQFINRLKEQAKNKCK